MLSTDGPSLDELEKAKKFLTGSYALRFDTSTKIAGQLVNIQRDGLEPSYLDERNAKIDAVTLEDARRAARRLLGDGKVSVAVAGRPQGISYMKFPPTPPPRCCAARGRRSAVRRAATIAGDRRSRGASGPARA